MFDGIWRMGDQDECSLKHVNHATAAIVCGKSWRDGADYPSPWPSTDFKPAAWDAGLAAKWEKVEALYALVGRDRFLEAALTVPICEVYLGSYLEDEWSDDLSPTERLTLRRLSDERRAQRRLDDVQTWRWDGSKLIADDDQDQPIVQ